MDNKMKYVHAVYRTGSFTKAAAELFISQPSLSAMIKRAETDLGAEIFQRNRSGIMLTDAGKIYIEYIEQEMKNEQHLKERIWEIRNESRGTIRLGATNYIMSNYIPPILNEIQRNYPLITFELYESNSPNLHDMLRNDDIDITIDTFGTDDASLIHVPLVSEAFLAVVPANNPFNNIASDYQLSRKTNESGSPAAFSKNPLTEKLVLQLLSNAFVLLKPGNESYNRIIELFSYYNVKPDIPYYLDQFSTCLDFAKFGLASSFMPDIPLRYRLQEYSIKLYQIDYPTLMRDQYIILRRGSYISNACRIFIDTARQVLK